MDLLNSLSNLMPGVAPGVAQARITHTPIFPASYADPTVRATYTQDLSPITVMPLTQRTGLSIGDIFKSGVIQTQPWMLDDTLPHEILHAATVGDLKPGSKTYQLAQRALPQQVRDEVPRMWAGVSNQFDAVHEGVARFLTSPDYSDKKWNRQKQSLINVFPSATKAQITRLMAAHQ